MSEGKPEKARRRSAPKPRRPTGAETELQARVAEVEWLKRHYDEQLRAAFTQIGELQQQLEAASAAHPAQPAPPRETHDLEEHAELERLRAELQRLAAAESRYLDRIEELKEARS